jgi:hypothetical protein
MIVPTRVFVATMLVMEPFSGSFIEIVVLRVRAVVVKLRIHCELRNHFRVDKRKPFIGKQSAITTDNIIE